MHKYIYDNHLKKLENTNYLRNKSMIFLLLINNILMHFQNNLEYVRYL